MGKVNVRYSIGNGRYYVDVLYNKERLEAEIQFLELSLAELDQERADLSEQYDQAVADRNQIADAIDQAVAAYIAAGGTGLLDVEAELIALAQASSSVQSADVRLTMIKGRILQTEKRKEMLESAPTDFGRVIDCADVSDDLTGDIRSLEIPDEGVTNMTLYPDYWRYYSGDAFYSQERDGQIMAREAQVSYQAFFNAAILPGVQRHYPGFRYATVSMIDKTEHTASIAYSAIDSSAQDLIVNDPGGKRDEVPIQYMECDSHIFEDGDRVLVELEERDWQRPKIIGFAEKPKRCPIIMAYNLGWRFGTQIYTDSDPSGYPSVPSGTFRDQGVFEVTVKLWGGDGLGLLYSRELQAVIDSTVISEMPPFSASGFIDLPEIEKGFFEVPTTTIERNFGFPLDVPWLGTKIVGGSAFPISKPPDPYILTPDQLTVTFRQYKQGFQFYNDGGIGQVHWSNQVDTTVLAGESTVTCTLDDFPETITWQDHDYLREEFVAFVPFDFNNNRGESDQWFLDRICILYRAAEIPYLPSPSQQIVVEMPYLFAGKAKVGSGRIAALVARPEDADDATLRLSLDNETYTPAGDLQFSPSATLKEPIGRKQKTITLNNDGEIQSASPGDIAQLGQEVVIVESVTANGEDAIVVVGRGALDTVPVEHPADERILTWKDETATSETEYQEGLEVYAKVLPRNGDGSVPESAVDPIVVTVSSRAVRPYPPGNVRVDGTPYPEADDVFLAPVTITWAHRDRLSETDPIVDTTTGDVGPEPGVTYALQVRSPGNALVVDESGLAVTSWAEVNELAAPGEYAISLWSQRVALTEPDLFDIERDVAGEFHGVAWDGSQWLHETVRLVGGSTLEYDLYASSDLVNWSLLSTLPFTRIRESSTTVGGLTHSGIAFLTHGGTTYVLRLGRRDFNDEGYGTCRIVAIDETDSGNSNTDWPGGVYDGIACYAIGSTFYIVTSFLQVWGKDISAGIGSAWSSVGTWLGFPDPPDGAKIKVFRHGGYHYALYKSVDVSGVGTGLYRSVDFFNWTICPGSGLSSPGTFTFEAMAPLSATGADDGLYLGCLCRFPGEQTQSRILKSADGLNFTTVDHVGFSARTDMLRGSGFVAGYQLVNNQAIVSVKTGGEWFTTTIDKNLRDMASNGVQVLYYGAANLGYIGEGGNDVLLDSYQKHEFSIIKG